MVNTKGLIFDIQSFSVHDGPGCRTTVFMSGCPLSCRWCANPESWIKKPHIMFSELSCKYEKGCRICKDKCTKKGLSFDKENKPVLNFHICKSCTTFECAKACYQNALKVCSKEYSTEELMNILTRDSNNWRSGGGVTFSGGDPLSQSNFLLEILKKCKEKGIHTAIETTAYSKEEIFLDVMKHIDFAFIDIKHMDREKHKEKAGVYNDLIHSNITSLAKSSWKGRLVLRMPVIHGFNDNDDNILQLVKFMNFNGLVEINILPFHRLGESKWTQLGQSYDYSLEGDVSDSRLKEIQNMFLQNSIVCYIGHDTLF
nr:4-hydroxyphenylacetate decarboxylase activase [Clostridium sp. CX1]